MNLGEYPGWLCVEYRIAWARGVGRTPRCSRYGVLHALRDAPEWHTLRTVLFRRGRGDKIECAVCGASGYPDGSWMLTHLHTHVTCPECGARRSSLSQHARVHARERARLRRERYTPTHG